MLLFSGGLGEGVLGNPDVLDRLICFEDRRAKHMFGLFVVDVVIWKRRVFCWKHLDKRAWKNRVHEELYAVFWIWLSLDIFLIPHRRDFVTQNWKWNQCELRKGKDTLFQKLKRFRTPNLCCCSFASLCSLCLLKEPAHLWTLQMTGHSDRETGYAKKFSSVVHPRATTHSQAVTQGGDGVVEVRLLTHWTIKMIIMFNPLTPSTLHHFHKF